MNYARLCISCMREKPDDRTVCPYCGFDSAGYTAENSALKPLTVLNGKYIIGRVVGAGGFGITYTALDVILERRVAIKEFFMRNGSMDRNTAKSNVVTSSVSDASDSRNREASQTKFEKEARTLAHLEHLEGIVSVYDYFHENSTSYIVMEYLDGQTLKQYVRECGHGLSFDEVMEKLTPVMKSLQKLHDKGVLHRDISPDNIMIRSDGSVVLFDFGGAKVYDETSGKSIVVLQKKGYTPYEQVVNEKQGPYTDVYAMAATIYFCLCGKAPVEALKRAGQADPLEMPSNAGAPLTPRQEKVLLKALSVMPEDRYQSIRDFYEAFFRDEPSVPEKKKTSIVAVGAIAVLSAVIVVSSFLLFRMSRQSNNQQTQVGGNLGESEQLSGEQSLKQSEAESQRAPEAESQKAPEAESQKALVAESQKASEAESQKTSEAESQKASEEESRKASEAESQKASEAESQQASEAESQKASEAESQKASEAESQKASEAESQKASEESQKAAEGNVYGDSLSIGYAPDVLANARVGDYVTFGTYEQDNNTDNGKEQIEWQVLAKSDSKALLLSRYALDVQPYNEDEENLTWEESTLRTWLNNDFYNEAFSDTEKSFIAQTPLKDNTVDLNIWEECGKTLDGYDVTSGNDTEDHVFALSFKQLRKFYPDWDYINGSDELIVYPTDYAIESGIWTNDDTGATWWWLRTPGLTQHSAANINSHGSLNSNTVSTANGGVRPALKVTF